MVLEAAGLTSGIANIFDIATQAVTFMTTNPVTLLFFGGSLIGLGVGAYYKIKGMAR